ncbi:MAG: phosphate signaling complex protein PhoU [Galactobacillus timonensis]|jgi:phosphate transport system protein|uniref:phosphate signaling complex protein PhoU n=1 Tax=Galactobacillus timonensis TaxID=2041840 RepID=UPI000C83628A|nr:phosphate signaling complex protein PhoU [Galactobacillus timonensis]MDY5222253.1 phosphate signaling complex protein PhoU [Lachnospiraceae bacterium]HCV55610.1 phosphate transport system regulatory protein PhoU [Erysipelotrichaceae bacterium]MCI6067099.1 phosphate signaling complex protein PhoU [Galactobacillus timonensis]MDD5850762.1 phosphate signaling complex protein PhoU [Galactobacillus timonensis]MDD6370309.1 phosphate signaling complex protein PhoU [Galactobacillus timonensis]
MREHFDDQLATLRQSVAHMGSQCELAIHSAVTALMEDNTKLARSVIGLESETRREEREIENLCLKLLLQQQPVASDLRDISAVLKAIYDLERIGIISADIADIVINEHVSTASQIIDIQKMADTTSKMVTNAITALNTKDEDLARKTIAMDDIVDKAFISAKQELISSFTKDTNVEYVLNLLMIAKYFEKIGDHAVNIAAWALFAITGVHTEEGGVN